jgi:hypothetical protein
MAGDIALENEWRRDPSRLITSIKQITYAYRPIDELFSQASVKIRGVRNALEFPVKAKQKSGNEKDLA